MGKDIKHQTTVYWKCDGCGREHVHTDPKIESNHALPPGWLQIFISTKERSFTQHSTGAYSVTYFRAIALGPDEKDLESIISCDLCFKKLRDAFRSKFAEEPGVQSSKPPPTAPSSDGHVPKQETFFDWIANLLTRKR